MSLEQTLLEERGKVWHEAKALIDSAEAEGRDFTAEEQEKYDRLTADLDSLSQRAERQREIAQRQADLEASVPAPAQRAEADNGVSERLRSFLTGETRGFEGRWSEARDLTKGSATAGGNTVPTNFINRLYEHLIETATVASISTVITTDGGENIEMPVTTAHSTGALITEGSNITESDPAFAKRTLGAYKYAVLMQISSELLSDTGVDLEGYLARQAGRAVGNALGADLAVGNGSSKPSGVAQTSTLGVTGANSVAGVFTADNLIDLYFSVIGPYRNSPSCGWLMRDATLANVRKLKDTTNQYLWQPSYQAGLPDTLLGKPVYTDPNIAAVAATAKSVFFGDFSAYVTRLAGGVRFERSDEFAFNADLVTFRAIVRGDGILADQTGAVKHFAGGTA
jgi:HK97 family phage major capsid protein